MNLVPSLFSLFLSLSLSAEIYRANALPSAGAMTFIQTIMCDLNGDRDAYKTDMPLYPNAT